MNEAGTNQTMPQKCPQCGASLPASALAGLCPACLLQQGAAADTATRPESKPFVPPTVEEVARLFPQLEVLGFLGKGGMGAVYKARQPVLDRLVALKILPAQTAPDPGFADRFTREARALARLSHPNIVAVHEFGQVSSGSVGVPPASEAGVPPAVPSVPSRDGSGTGETPVPPVVVPPALPYFIMEFVDGVNLRQLQKASRLSPREALQIVPQICDALQYAHDEGVVHRDIKPENVLVDRKGRVKIADFGLAKILGCDPEALRLTGEGQIMGTPHYMAPEQVEHPQDVDHRADIFSLGVVFYEMLTSELPLGKFQPPSSRMRGIQVDVRLDEVVLHALEKEPERRYQKVSEVKSAVEMIGTTPPISRRTADKPLNGAASGPLPSKPRPLCWVSAAVTAAVVWCVTFFAAACLTFNLPKTFESTVRIKVERGVQKGMVIAEPEDDAHFLKTQSELIKSEVMLGPVIEALKLKEVWSRKYNNGQKLSTTQTMELLRGCVDLRHASNTSLISIRVFRDRPDEAARIANAIAESYQRYRANQKAQLSRDLQRQLKAQLNFEDARIAAARRELDQLQKTLSLPEAAAQQSRDPALADAKERPFWQKKRDLEDLLRFRNELASKVLSESTANVLPQIPSVEIIDRAVPALHPSRPNKPLNLALGALAGMILGLLAGGLVLLLSFLRPPPKAPFGTVPIASAQAVPPRSGGRAWRIAGWVIAAAVLLNVVIAFVALRPGLSKPLRQSRGSAAAANTNAQVQQSSDAVNHRAPVASSTLADSTSLAQTATPEQFGELPTLRFLAWQDEWKTNQPAAARHPDGSPVTDPTELDWLHQIQPGGMDVSSLQLKPEPQFLHLWISHLAFDPNSFNEIALLDAAGKPIQLGGGASFSVGNQEPNDRNGKLGWLTPTLSPGEGTNLPSSMTIRLCYTVGPLERIHELPVTPNTVTRMSLEGGSALNGVGQNVDGKAFVAIAVSVESMRGRRFGVIAVAKDGREIPSKGGGQSGSVGAAVGIADFEFDLPLADVAKFRIGTRPIRTNEWRDVVLPQASSVETTKERARQAANAPFIAALPQGEIELVALSRHRSTKQSWWQADGAVWTNAAFENPARHTSDTKGQRFEFIFQRRGLPKDTMLEYSFEPGALETSSGDSPLRQGKALPDHNLVAALLPESAEEVSIRLGVAAGEWKKVAARAAQTGGGGSFTLGHKTCTALFLDPVESGGETRIGVSFNKVPGWTMRVTATDTSGQLHESFPYSQSVGDTASAEGRFKGLPLSRVKEFRFEARPYAYVEFRDVSLEPGRRTQVKVLDAEDK